MQAPSSRLLLQWGTTSHLPGTFTRRYRMYFTYRYQDFTNRIIIWQIAIAIVTRSLVCVCLQNCEKRRTIRRTALNNFISETSLPVTEYDTSFQTLINTRQRAIDDIVLEALHQHGYWRVYSSIVIANSSRLSHFEFHLYHSVYFTDPFGFNYTSTPHSFANCPTENCRASPHTFKHRPFSSIPSSPSTFAKLLHYSTMHSNTLTLAAPVSF